MLRCEILLRISLDGLSEELRGLLALLVVRAERAAELQLDGVHAVGRVAAVAAHDPPTVEALRLRRRAGRGVGRRDFDALGREVAEDTLLAGERADAVLLHHLHHRRAVLRAAKDGVRARRLPVDVQQQRALGKLLPQLIYELAHLPVERGMNNLHLGVFHGFLLRAVRVHVLRSEEHTSELQSH